MLLKVLQVLIVKILNSFNPKTKLKDTECAIKSKLTDLLTQKVLNSWQN